MQREVYLDNSATSYPKPEIVTTQMDEFSRIQGGSGGRSGHRKSIAAYCMITEARERIACLFHAPMPETVCFMSNATEALNTAIYGLASPGCEIVTTSMEHNSVWRPLTDLHDRLGCKVNMIGADRLGICAYASLKNAITPNTTFVVLNCASNVTGAIQPFWDVAKHCQKYNVPLILDAAQAAGTIPIDLRDFPYSAFAFTGHKGLLGPQGTGGLILDFDLAKRMRPLKRGGTGTLSESAAQPEALPEKFESGTSNGPGIAGLSAGVSYVLEKSVAKIRNHEMFLWQLFRTGLQDIPGVCVYGPSVTDKSVAIVSITIDGMQPADISFLLDAEGAVMTRSGLHCAPLAHETIGTMPLGTVRFSFGLGNTELDVALALKTLNAIARR